MKEQKEPRQRKGRPVVVKQTNRTDRIRQQGNQPKSKALPRGSTPNAPEKTAHANAGSARDALDRQKSRVGLSEAVSCRQLMLLVRTAHHVVGFRVPRAKAPVELVCHGRTRDPRIRSRLPAWHVPPSFPLIAGTWVSVA